MKIEAAVQHENRDSNTTFIDSVQTYGSVQSAQKSRSVQSCPYSKDPYNVQNF
jgi:hypothetical protein